MQVRTSSSLGIITSGIPRFPDMDCAVAGVKASMPVRRDAVALRLNRCPEQLQNAEENGQKHRQNFRLV